MSQKYHVRTIKFNGSNNVTNEETIKIIDSMAQGQRVIFLNAQENNRKMFLLNQLAESPFTVEIFDRGASDRYISDYLECEYELDDQKIDTIIKFNDMSCQEFLEKYANHVSSELECCVRHKIMEKYKEYFETQCKENLVEMLLGVLDKMPCEALAKLYSEKFLNENKTVPS